LIFLTPKKLDDLAIYFLRIIIYTITFLVFKVGNNIKIIGRENIPSGSRILFLSNHQTLIDSFLVALGTLSFSDVFFHTNKFAYNVPESKNFYYNGFLRIFFKALKTVPISRSGASRAKIEAQVNQFCHLLTKSNLAVFFEGTRTRDGKINECRVGPALTIIKARPNYVVPILLENIQPIMPIKHGSKINLHISMGGHRGRMIIGKPLNVSKFYQEDYSWETAVVQSDELRQLIKEAVENLKPSE
jgi:1-acyl-sn-glycerol-3-phosphate acyltransferase